MCVRDNAQRRHAGWQRGHFVKRMYALTIELELDPPPIQLRRAFCWYWQRNMEPEWHAHQHGGHQVMVHVQRGQCTAQTLRGGGGGEHFVKRAACHSQLHWPFLSLPNSGVCFDADSGTWNQNGTITITAGSSGYGMCVVGPTHCIGVGGGRGLSTVKHATRHNTPHRLT
jgi:hypothetical protein